MALLVLLGNGPSFGHVREASALFSDTSGRVGQHLLVQGDAIVPNT